MQMIVNSINPKELPVIDMPDGSKEIDVYAPIESAVRREGNIKNLNTEIKTTLDWVKIKKMYAEIPSTFQKMSNFLAIRYMMLKFMIGKTLTQYTNIFSKCENSPTWHPFDFEGKLNKFNTKCVRVTFKHFENVLVVEGQFFFSAIGSGTLTSDIDLNVDFKFTDHDKHHHRDQIFIILRIISKFIRKYTELFWELFKTSSGEALDLNLYTLNFAYEQILQKILRLRKEHQQSEFKDFMIGNRQTVLHFLIDGQFFMNKNDKQTSHAQDKEIVQNIELIKKKTKEYFNNPPNVCSHILFTQESLFAPLDENMHNRSIAMADEIDKSSDSSELHLLKSLCYILSGNMKALESYIPVGAIIDIMDLQGGLNKEREIIKKFSKVIREDNNFQLDNLLMNFSYAVIHYYHSLYHSTAALDYRNAVIKFAKYTSRIIRAVALISEKNNKECWMNAINVLDNKVNYTEYWDLKRVKTWAADTRFKLGVRDIMEGTKIISEFFAKGYKCTSQYSMNMIDVNITQAQMEMRRLRIRRRRN